MIIDCRCRPPTKEFLSFLRSKFYLEHVFPRWAVHPYPRSAIEASMEQFWGEFEDAGITKGVLSYRCSPGVPGGTDASNDYMAGLVAQYPDKLISIAAIDPSNQVHQAVPEIERCIKKLGMKGVAIEPANVRPPMRNDDERLYPIFEKCVELDVPLFLFTSPFLGDTLEFNHPRTVEPILRRFRRLQVILPHGGWPYVMEYMGMAARYSNLNIMPDCFVFLPGCHMYLEAANSFLQNQVCFGSAYPVGDMRMVLEFHERYLINDIAQQKVLAGNAQRLLKI